jgi:hypothetical protein
MQGITQNSTQTIANKIQYSDGQTFGALILVVFVAAAAGLLVGMLSGFKLPNFKPFNGK